jgi:hypothetical protein
MLDPQADILPGAVVWGLWGISHRRIVHSRSVRPTVWISIPPLWRTGQINTAAISGRCRQ